MWPEDDEINAALRGDSATTDVQWARHILAGAVLAVLAAGLLYFVISSI